MAPNIESLSQHSLHLLRANTEHKLEQFRHWMKNTMLQQTLYINMKNPLFEIEFFTQFQLDFTEENA